MDPAQPTDEERGSAGKTGVSLRKAPGDEVRVKAHPSGRGLG
jgi:hypothetical protein